MYFAFLTQNKISERVFCQEEAQLLRWFWEDHQCHQGPAEECASERDWETVPGSFLHQLLWA